MGFKEAVRQQAFARIGLCGAAGAGKTTSALLFASGLSPEGRILVIDTENFSASMAVGMPGVPKFLVDSLDEPYTIARYLKKIDEALKEEPDVLIIDSISHAWASAGGILEQVDRIKSGGANSMQAWREQTPKHNAFVNKLLGMPCHLICTMRSQTQYVIERDDRTGKNVPRKVGMKPIQREGMDYEFTTVLDIDQSEHFAKPSKDRTGLYDGEMPGPISPNHGFAMREWFESGAEVPEMPVEDVEDTPDEEEKVTAAPSRDKKITQAAIERLTSLAVDAGVELPDLANFTMNDAIEFAAELKKKSSKK